MSKKGTKKRKKVLALEYKVCYDYIDKGVKRMETFFWRLFALYVYSGKGD